MLILQKYLFEAFIIPLSEKHLRVLFVFQQEYMDIIMLSLVWLKTKWREELSTKWRRFLP